MVLISFDPLKNNFYKMEENGDKTIENYKIFILMGSL